MADSMNHATFPTTSTGLFLPKRQRTIDLAITGGAGYFTQGPISPFQATANADFYAQTSILDLTAGFHWGFSDPSTKELSIGLRFPVDVSDNGVSGFFADAAFLMVDAGVDSVAFWPGVRAALVQRTGPLEFRVAGEIRRFPFDGDQFQAWGGLELGFVINLLREDLHERTPKDSLREELRYLATADELEQLDKTVSNADIDSWLDKFWSSRDPSGSAQNELRAEYMRRVRIANEKYGTPRTMGVSTDRGRVFLLYGQPDRIENVNSVNGADRKFELWVEENRVQGHELAFFLFVSSAYSAARGIYEGHGDYREIYSNVSGEPSEGLPSDLPAAMQSYIEGFR